MKTKLATLLGSIGIGALLLLPTTVGNSAPLNKKTVPAARAQQVDPEARASKNAPRLKEAMTNLNNRIQLVYKGNTNANIVRINGVLIGPKSKYVMPFVSGGISTWVIASNRSTVPLEYTATVDGSIITGKITPTGIHHAFNTNGFTVTPTITIENKGVESVFLVFTQISEFKRVGLPVLQEDRLIKLGNNLVDRTEAAVKTEVDIEFPYNTLSMIGFYSNVGSWAWPFSDFGISPAWYITGCGDDRTDHISLEVFKVGVATPIVTGDDGDAIPHLIVEPKQNLKTGSIKVKNSGSASAFCAFLRFK